MKVGEIVEGELQAIERLKLGIGLVDSHRLGAKG